MVVSLEVHDLKWLSRGELEPSDLCAHGQVRCVIDGSPLPELEGFECTVSAAALYLMRSVSGSRRSAAEEHMFPCCGFVMYEVDSADDADVLICGCSVGVHLDVIHDGEAVKLEFPGGQLHRVPLTEWRAAVLGFACQVADFYRRSTPKVPSDDDKPGFERFLREWRRRYGEELTPGAS